MVSSISKKIYAHLGALACSGLLWGCLAESDTGGSRAALVPAAHSPASADEAGSLSPCDAQDLPESERRPFRLRPKISVERASDRSGRVRLSLANAGAFERGSPLTWSLGDGTVSRTAYGPVLDHDFGPGLRAGEPGRSFVVEVALESRGNVYVGRTCVRVLARHEAKAGEEAG